MKEFLHHLFVPRHSNNHRSKLLHHDSLLFVVAILVVLQLVFTAIKSSNPQILGTSSSIITQELLTVTNQKREEHGLSPLTLNETLSGAAYLKSQDMFSKNYWAHTGPDGTTPWIFFNKAGYQYTYAGENLARGFTTSTEVVDAWMNSPSHRDNMLSPHYTEIGFAIEDGTLVGESTTLVVELFGKRNVAAPIEQPVVRVDVPQQSTQSAVAAEISNNNPPIRPKTQLQVASIKAKPLVDSKLLSWNVSTIVLSLFIFTLILDMIVIERKKIVRLVGHNVDHIVFLVVIFLFITIFIRGVIV